MTIKFTIKHTYRDIPIEISVEARDVNQLDILLKDAMDWLIKSRDLIDKCITSLSEKRRRP